MKEKNLIIQKLKSLTITGKKTKVLTTKNENTALIKSNLSITKKADKEIANPEKDSKEKKSTTPRSTKKTKTSTKKTTVAKKSTDKATITTEVPLTTVKNATPKKTTKKVDTEKSTAKKTTTKKTDSEKSTTRKANTKKIDTVKSVVPKTTTKKSATKRSISDKSITSKASRKKITKKETLSATKLNIHANEYFDLPYRYNETTVKLLAQTPTRLFVYWDIADSDRELYIKHFGKDFFNDTIPFLKITNETKNYTFDIDINDFANSWYIDVNDDNSKYSLELYRRFKNVNLNKELETLITTFNQTHSNILNAHYIYIATSNKMDTPNGSTLSVETPRTIMYKNIHTGKISYVTIYNEFYNEFYNIFFNSQANDVLKDMPSSNLNKK